MFSFFWKIFFGSRKFSSRKNILAHFLNTYVDPKFPQDSKNHTQKRVRWAYRCDIIKSWKLITFFYQKLKSSPELALGGEVWVGDYFADFPPKSWYFPLIYIFLSEMFFLERAKIIFGTEIFSLSEKKIFMREKKSKSAKSFFSQKN